MEDLYKKALLGVITILWDDDLDPYEVCSVFRALGAIAELIPLEIVNEWMSLKSKAPGSVTVGEPNSLMDRIYAGSSGSTSD